MKVAFAAALLFLGLTSMGNAGTSFQDTPSTQSFGHSGPETDDFMIFRNTTTAGDCMRAAMAYGNDRDYAIVTIHPLDEEHQDFAHGCSAKYEK